ncbi:DMT family transporter [Oxynema sp. CENA135]|uniref:DMT family transporter n=1 Tax=Oxynema sp. CENA135 TaxID=984206 RepID=UPI001F30CC58|nr:DMT family transporter [Oxynema sp. CENA135]
MRFQGEFAALGAAMVWTVASVIYSKVGAQIAPLVLNLAKGAIAIVLTLGTAIALGAIDADRGVWVADLDRLAVGSLLLSGAIGIGVGDTAFFRSLNALDPRRALLLQTLAPPLSALLAIAVLRETLSPRAWFGIVLTMLGIAWAIAERVGVSPADRQGARRGILWGAISALAQATGAILSRGALAETAIDPLVSSLLRLCAGMLVLLAWLSCGDAPREPLRERRTRQSLLELTSPRLFGAIAIAAFLGTYLGIWLQQMSLKFAPAGIAQTLSATSPLFAIALARLMGERVTARATLGAIVALFGVTLLLTAG